ncbi:MAG: TIGR00341 family protein, partial [Candidatus Melainabacteria bacterium HGW-Melainabacteria-1]
MSDTDNEQPKHVPRAERTTKLRVFTDWHLVDRFRHLFSLREDADEASTVQDITRAIEFRGANLWALIFAILLASVGLNINSAAVIIGAMLISPLMGPIMGVGLALGTNDLMLFKRSLRNLLVAVSISVMTSTIYFLLTPLGQAQSELLART